MAITTTGGGKFVVQKGTTAAPTPNYAQQLYDVKKRAETRESQGAGSQELSGYGSSADKIRSLMGVGKDDTKYGAQTNAADLYKLMHPENQITDTSTVQPAPATTTTPTAVTPQQSTSGLIGSIYDNSYAAQLEKLRAARDVATQGLNKIQTGAEQSAYDNRNQADVVNAQGGQRLREQLANAGLISSGDNLSASAQLAAARQGEIGSINRNLGNTVTDLNERRSLIANNAMNDEKSLLQTVDAARSTALLNDRYHGDDMAMRLAQMSGNLPGGGGQTLEAINAARQFGIQQGGLTGTYNNAPTVDMLRLNRGALESDRNYNRGTFESDRNFNLQQGQQEWENTFKQGQFDHQKAQDIWERTFKDKSFDQSVNQFAQQMGLDYSKMSQSQQQFTADQAFKNKTLGWQMDPSNPENKYKNSLSDYRESQANKNVGQNPIDNKTSTDNYNIISGELQTQGVTKDKARQLLEANRDNLTDSDYRKLMNDINANF